jgi:hypothetical protein
VTVTRLVAPGDGDLGAYFAEVEDGLADHRQPRAVPERATPVVGLDLTTHEGHFMGAGHNRLLLYEDRGRAWVRAVGTWDPMPWHLAKAYQAAGEKAQHAFWGQGGIEALSMLHQLARQVAA